jgi:hypothetical protein
MFLQNFYMWKPFRAVAALLFVGMVLVSCNGVTEQAAKEQSKTSSVAKPKTENISIASLLTSEQKAVLLKLQKHESTKTILECGNAMNVKIKLALQRGIDRKALAEASAKGDAAAIYSAMGISIQEAEELGMKMAAATLSFKQTLNPQEVAAFESISKLKCSQCDIANFSANVDNIGKMDFFRVPDGKGSATVQGDNLCCGFICVPLAALVCFLSPLAGAIFFVNCMWECIRLGGC